MTVSQEQPLLLETNEINDIRILVFFISCIFIQFLLERLEIAKYSSVSQVNILLTLINKSLLLTVGKHAPLISRHPAAIGPRLK